jgi:hypothetical protein
MDRALDPKLIAIALGEHESLPSSEEVAQLLASAELALLLRNPEVPEQLIAIGWYLHAIASSKYALREYGIERQRVAFSVAGHIFDLLLQSPNLSKIDRLIYCFAAQIAYLRSTLDPNALAVYRREIARELDNPKLISAAQEVALSCGVAVLGFDARYIFPITQTIRNEISDLQHRWGVENISSTPLGSAAGVALGSRDLMSFLMYGNVDLLDRARDRFRTAVTSENSPQDLISRWIAAHLLNVADDLGRTSIWKALPPDISSGIRKAFSLGHPKILTLWPPQIDLFKADEQGDINPLSPDVKRLFLSTPTSSGKTLMAQLLVVSHLVTAGTSVCYVAPTRSLCSEIRKSLESRLRFLGKQIIAGLPEGDWFDIFLDFEPDVEVMTPERLCYLLRADSERLLGRFGLFVFDEAHLVGEQDRGWTLEQDLTYLHYATLQTDHRIVLMSAAVGNRNHFVTWMNRNGDPVVARHSPWRGPRRLHAIWTTDVDWALVRTEKSRSKDFPIRQYYPLYGVLSARISQTGNTHVLRTAEPVGELIFRVDSSGNREEYPNGRTPFYKTLVPIIKHLAKTGPVLVIESTRPATVRLAQAIADKLDTPNNPSLQSLIDLVEAQLGANHPLPQVLRKGVAYHHGSLPDEIRTAIEDSVSAGHLNYLVATTTLTEGVNLPVQSVVIASQGSYDADGNLVEYITGSKLINAIGRAGRATKETEGIVVLARPAAPVPDDFKRLSPEDSDIQITSILATEKALNALAAFEEIQRSMTDAILQTDSKVVADFTTFVWYIASELEKLGTTPILEHITEVLNHSLAWVQLSKDNKDRWLAVAQLTAARYAQTDSSTRRRWASAGTTIGSASKIEEIVQEVYALVKDRQDLQDPVEAVKLIIDGDRLLRILKLPEAPQKKVYDHRTGKYRQEIVVPFGNLISAWLQGVDLISLAESFLSAVPDVDYRFEQLGDFIYAYFEIYFPWIFGTIVTWTNRRLELDNPSASPLPRSLPANIRWGVSHSVALNLILNGLQSRTLATRVAKLWGAEERSVSVHQWIRSMSLAEWRATFNATPAELRSILEYARDKRGGAAVDLLTQGVAKFDVVSVIQGLDATDAVLSNVDNSDLSPIAIQVGSETVGHILSRDQTDIQNLLNTGLTLSIRFSASSGNGTLELRLINPDT